MTETEINKCVVPPSPTKPSIVIVRSHPPPKPSAPEYRVGELANLLLVSTLRLYRGRLSGEE